jgi:hypothetical protein
MRETTEYPNAYVKEINGELVLIDPVAEALIDAIGKDNCFKTMKGQLERVQHFRKRMSELQKDPKEVVIVLINVDAPFGKDLAEALMPGHDWQQYRDQDQIPFARGLAMKESVAKYVKNFDEQVYDLMISSNDETVLVIDHGTAMAFHLKDD